jgi:hypothetical protein
LRKLFRQVPRHAIDVLHHLPGLFEDRRIEPLQKVRLPALRIAHGDAVRTIDVPLCLGLDQFEIGFASEVAKEHSEMHPAWCS